MYESLLSYPGPVDKSDALILDPLAKVSGSQLCDCILRTATFRVANGQLSSMELMNAEAQVHGA